MGHLTHLLCHQCMHITLLKIVLCIRLLIKDIFKTSKQRLVRKEDQNRMPNDIIQRMMIKYWNLCSGQTLEGTFLYNMKHRRKSFRNPARLWIRE